MAVCPRNRVASTVNAPDPARPDAENTEVFIMQDTTKQTPYGTPTTDEPREGREMRDTPGTGSQKPYSWEQPQGKTGYGGEEHKKEEQKKETGTTGS